MINRSANYQPAKLVRVAQREGARLLLIFTVEQNSDKKNVCVNNSLLLLLKINYYNLFKFLVGFGLVA